ncbi:molybdopterin-dependent oxidoreductase [Rhodobacteraceae bacterium]|nr:molybdopterin-dependent oxidoreductase [Paracoccaceae bacterium]
MSNKNKNAASDQVSFHLNGKKITLAAPSPKLMLIDFLRQPDHALSGPKKPCGQGGCGGCTVVLSAKENNKVVHRSVNSCLRPVTALNGLSVTTIEGTGSVDGKMNKVAYELAKNNGTQCGYCTNGWVMCMTGYLANKPKKPSDRDVENLFDGNICRCTGYRTILTGMKQFSKTPPKAPMETVVDMAFAPKEGVQKTVMIPVPKGAFAPSGQIKIDQNGEVWAEARTVNDVFDLARKMRKTGPVRLVNGNTSFGIYKTEIESSHQFIDVRDVPELRRIDLKAGQLRLGAGVTYTELLDRFAGMKPESSSAFGVLQFMAQRTAGHIVRNAASLGGNTMLVLNHLSKGAPFPSDLFTALCGVDASVTYLDLSKGKTLKSVTLTDLMNKCLKQPKLADDLLLVDYTINGKKPGVHWAQKVALREVNSHSITNMYSNFSFKTKGGQLVFDTCRLVIGGLMTGPVLGTTATNAIFGKPVNDKTIESGIEALRRDLTKQLAQQARQKPYLKSLPDEGFDDAYRLDLATRLFFKAYLNAREVNAPGSLPKDEKSAAKRHWGAWPTSGGTQDWHHDNSMAPISEPYIKLMAMYQAQGEVRYTHETKMPATASYGAVVATTRAAGKFVFCLPGTSKPVPFKRLVEYLAENEESFVDLLSLDDIPAVVGGSNQKPDFGAGSDQPLFVEPGQAIMYGGQAITLVLARTQQDAERIAGYIQAECVAYPKKDRKAPILSLETAVSEGQIFPDSPMSASYMNHIWKVRRPKSDMKWAASKKPKPITLKDSHGKERACKVVAASQTCGGQLHFYMETQAAIAEPRDGDAMVVYSSTQSPKTVHTAVVKALGCDFNQVRVEVPQVGGAYGGKTEMSQWTAVMAAVAARKIGQPVYLALTRDTDSAMIGGRHPYSGDYQLAIGDDPKDPKNRGRILGLSGAMIGDGGAYYDCSFVVSDCIQLRVDSAYNVPNYETTIDVARTNKAPSTAYRAFGDIQGTLILENAIEEAAAALDMDPAVIREKSLYEQGDTVPSGQKLDHCYQDKVWTYTKRLADYDARKKQVADFNAKNKWRKRGLCLMPLKYGSGFNLVMLEQTTALVSIYSSDASILIQQGGADMGQGMVTQLAQIAAYELGVPLDIIRVAQADTSVIANPSSTGASTGTQYNGLAVKNACDMLKVRLKDYCAKMRKSKGTAWCKANNINYWDSPKKSWKAPVPGKGGKTYWDFIVGSAFNDRVNLQAQAKAVIKGGTKPISTDNIVFKPKSKQPKGTGIAIDPKGGFSEPVNEYVGFTYNAACSEVEIDVLTGETKIIRADIVHDMGRSLNPAIDVGQIEGAFVQGIGYLLTEQMVHQPDGDNAGQLNTVNTWRYKPPAVPTIPLEMNVRIFPGKGVPKKIWKDKNALYSSKEVGEPPMVLANSVFFALKSAIRAARIENGHSKQFDLPAPATVQTVYKACWPKQADREVKT